MLWDKFQENHYELKLIDKKKHTKLKRNEAIESVTTETI